MSIASISSLDAPAVFVTAGRTIDASPSWPAWLAIAWAVGALIVAVRLARGHLAARRLAHTAEPSVPESWSVALREAAASLALTKRVELLRSERIGSPMTIGVLRPRVLLPAAADAWSPERLRAVLVHELGHVRRHDTIIQLAAQLGCALYWWNPLAWLAAARLR
ncbi:MAG: M56 family metallopeptidase, partial [Deltaproteobacteria bacterium]|nr:M56 family metallopeptidase [Deltaproteobacteria bacterium]